MEREQATDNLRKNLEKRPERDELIERKELRLILPVQRLSDKHIGNILATSQAAPALQASQKSLEKHMRADSLEHKIQQRPKPDELIKEGILKGDENSLKE